MIKRLILHNYRSYKDLDMNFSNLEIIKGRNGIGKTSIVEAIGFVFFGSTLQRGKANSWISTGEASGSVILYIDDFILERSNTLALVKDTSGKILAKNNTGITEWVEKEYGLTADLYRTSFFIGQKDIGAFAALSPMERTKRVEKLLRIDRLDVIKDKAKDKARTYTANLNTYVAKLENNIYNSEAVDNASANILESSEELEKVKAQLEEALIAEGAYRQLLAQWQTKEGLQKRFKGTLYNIVTLESEYESMVTYNATVEQHNKLVREKVSLEKKLTSTYILEEYFNSSMSDLLIQEQSLKSIQKLNIELDELATEPKEYDLHKLILELKTKQDIYDNNKKIPEICPTCGQDWPKKSTINLVELEEEIDKLNEFLLQARKASRSFEILEKIKTLPKTTLSLEDIAIAVNSLTFKAEYLRLKELEDIEIALRKHKDMTIDLTFARAQNDLNDRLEELKDIEKPQEVEVQSIKIMVSRLEKSIKMNQIVLDTNLASKVIIEEYTELREEAEIGLDLMKKFIKFVDQYRKSFGNNVIPLLETNVSNIVAYLSEGKYDKVKINSDYSIDNFEYYSGSEQDSISFALRLAIAQVSRLGKFKTMLLDEIAASFDSEREALLMDILKQQSNQLIYITHGEL